MSAAANSCDPCGWAAAFVSMLAFGSFGVPIKSKRSRLVDVDPLVFQSYKSLVCFVTAWLILLAGVPFTFSPYGLLSGWFWVPGGWATVYAVKNAGLAIGIGIGSSFIVLVSFIWGIFVFDERVHSRAGACLAILFMMLGLLGMSYFSSPENEASLDGRIELSSSADAEDVVSVGKRRGNIQYTGLDNVDDDNAAATLPKDALQSMDSQLKTTERTEISAFSDTLSGDEGILVEADEIPISSASHHHELETILLFGIKFTRRQTGMLAAVFCGVWGGSIMAPMKWVPDDDKGIHFLLSFAIGAAVVTVQIWFLRYLYNVYRCKSWSLAYSQLPSFHIRVMWLPGGLAGVLWSLGNFFSLISVFYLGEGVGYPLVQTSILVSGLWGIFYFNEVSGTERVAKWIASSLLTIFGILLLSYEHHEK